MPINFRRVDFGEIVKNNNIFNSLNSLLDEMNSETDREFLEYHGELPYGLIPPPDFLLYTRVHSDFSLAYEIGETERLIGFIISTRNINLDTINIDKLYIQPNKRGVGIATDLFKFHMERLNPGNEIPITLTVAEYNSRAIRFYDSLGFMPMAQKMYLTKD